jgi:hypothetical protein
LTLFLLVVDVGVLGLVRLAQRVSSAVVARRKSHDGKVSDPVAPTPTPLDRLAA